MNREVDSRTGTIQVRAEFPNPGTVLRPGQDARIRAVTESRKGALLVPQASVSELQGVYHWYNRAGVEHVMGFCTEEQYRQFLKLCPTVERYVVDAGIIIIKYWLEVGKKEQQGRFEARIKDPLRQWKLSPMDLESYRRWYEYSQARDNMLAATDSKHAPRCLVRSDDKRKARLNCISHLLSRIPYRVKLPKRSEKHGYDDQLSHKRRKFVPEKF